MGYCINPENESKESFLQREGTETRPEFPQDPDLALECLVNNGPFTAAAIAYSYRELEVFIDPADQRTKYWFTVPKSVVQAVLDKQPPYEVPRRI
jgi:hypothetical protein